MQIKEVKASLPEQRTTVTIALILDLDKLTIYRFITIFYDGASCVSVSKGKIFNSSLNVSIN